MLAPALFALGSARDPRLKTKIEIILVPGCFAIHMDKTRHRQL
jgi:hypothetical protein